MIDKNFAMNLLSSVRMPVGKYKGQDLDVIMASDPNYIEWISQQEWFRQQHTHIYKIIVNGYVDLQESPEHNALQARFLDEDLRIALANYLLPEITDMEALTYGAESAFVERYYTRSGRFPRFSFGEQSLQVGNPAFEFQGVDVCFSAERYVEVSMRGRVPRMTASICSKTIAVELKPTLGDEYVAVLRQILGAKSRLSRGYGLEPKCFALVTERFTVSNVSWEKVQQVFASQNVDLLLLSDIVL